MVQRKEMERDGGAGQKGRMREGAAEEEQEATAGHRGSRGARGLQGRWAQGGGKSMVREWTTSSGLQRRQLWRPQERSDRGTAERRRAVEVREQHRPTAGRARSWPRTRLLSKHRLRVRNHARAWDQNHGSCLPPLGSNVRQRYTTEAKDVSSPPTQHNFIFKNVSKGRRKANRKIKLHLL